MSNIIEFVIELKQYLRNLGRTEFVSKTYLETLYIKYNINVKDLENELENENKV